MQPIVSVLMPVYNAEKYLGLSLSSVLQQSLTNIEVVCLNDGSTDQSLAVLQQIAQTDPRVRVLTQPNQGVAAARNRLLQEARGEYIAFVDADDVVSADYLSALYKAASQTRAPVTKCLFYELEEDGTRRTNVHCHSSFSKPVPAGDGPRFRAGNEDAVLWGKLFNRQWLQQQGLHFWPGRVAEDISFIILAFVLASDVAFVPEQLYGYRKGVPGAITAQPLRMAAGILLNLAELREEFKRRSRWNAALAAEWIRVIVWGIARFHRFPAEQRVKQKPLMKKLFQAVQQETALLHGWTRVRWTVWVYLVRLCGPRSVYMWSKVFR